MLVVRSVRETHVLSNYGTRIALDMCVIMARGARGRETHSLFSHRTRIALDMCDHGERCLEEGDSLPIQPWNQDRISNVIAVKCLGEGDSRAIQLWRHDRIRYM